jgi:hypothetical protein
MTVASLSPEAEAPTGHPGLTQVTLLKEVGERALDHQPVFSRLIGVSPELKTPGDGGRTPRIGNSWSR